MSDIEELKCQYFIAKMCNDFDTMVICKQEMIDLKGE